jgi:hypothetical protein
VLTFTQVTALPSRACRTVGLGELSGPTGGFVGVNGLDAELVSATLVSADRLCQEASSPIDMVMPSTCPRWYGQRQVMQVRAVWLWACKTVGSERSSRPRA